MFQSNSLTTTAACTIRFEVRVPDETPESASIYLSGNQEALGSWRPDGIRLEPLGPGRFALSLEFPMGSLVFYKLSRGTWGTVELDKDGHDRPNRSFMADKSKTIHVTVLRWAEGSGVPQQRSCCKHVVDLGMFGHKSTGIDRPVLVHPPHDYDPKGTQTYPVLYMLDGQNVFDARTAFLGQEWQADERYDELYEKGKVHPFFIVAVNHENQRDRFFTPTRRHGLAGSGQLHKTHAMIAEEIAPALAARWRVRQDPASTGIMGSSLGGLAAFHLGWKHPEFYGMAAAMSPSLWWGHFETYDQVFGDRGPVKPVKFWIDTGTRESMWPHRPIRAIYHLTSLLRVRGYSVKMFIDQDAEHSEIAWRKRLHLPLLWFFGTGKRTPKQSKQDKTRSPSDTGKPGERTQP